MPQPNADASTQPSPHKLAYEAAVRDALTGLYTPAYMADTVARWVRFQDRDADQMVSVMLLDLDHLKRVNDTFGLPAGDEVLVRLAKIVQKQCRDEDLAVRMSGHAVAIFLFGDNPDAAPSLASRIVAAVRDATFAGALAGAKVTLSAGTTCRMRGETMAEVIARAEAALRSAKQAGRDRVETR